MTSSTAIREAQWTSRVIPASFRAQGSHDLTRLRVQERSHLPDDLRPRHRRQRQHRLRRVAQPHDQEGQRQGHARQHQQDLRALRRREDRIHLHQEPEEDRPGTRRRRLRAGTPGTHHQSRPRRRWPGLRGGVLHHPHQKGQGLIDISSIDLMHCVVEIVYFGQRPLTCYGRAVDQHKINKNHIKVGDEMSWHSLEQLVSVSS